MTKRYVLLIVVGVLWTGWEPSSAQEKPAPGGYVLERDKEVAKNEPGTHDGGGQTVGYSFFSKTPNLKLVFRKRAFKPGSAIGYHLQREDEIYYVLSGRGMMKIDGREFEVGPGDAILTRPDSSHGLKQIGKEDLVILINYEQAVSPRLHVEAPSWPIPARSPSADPTARAAPR
jgi:mannose-6-phosphate isomerase-like protein (cupin superfamily)